MRLCQQKTVVQLQGCTEIAITSVSGAWGGQWDYANPRDSSCGSDLWSGTGIPTPAKIYLCADLHNFSYLHNVKSNDGASASSADVSP